MFRSIRNSRGFSLLEVLIATLLVGVGIFAIMEAFNRGYLGVGEVEDYSMAVSLAEEKMEELRDQTFANVISSAKAAVSGFSSFQREVIVTNVNSQLKKVEVKTYWAVPNGEKNVNLTTYRSNS